MTQLKQIYFQQNEKFEYEFFEDEECIKKFEYNLNEKKLYIELKSGNITSAIALDNKCPYNRIDGFTLYICGYAPFFASQSLTLVFLDDAKCDYTKYIPDDCAVVFLNEKDLEKNRNKFTDQGFFVLPSMISVCKCKELNRFCKCTDEYSVEDCDVDAACIFIKELTHKNIRKINNTAKMLKKKYGIKWVEVFTELCFIKESGYDIEIGNYDYLPNSEYVDKFLTTNATGLLEPQDEEHFTVIDCKKIFEEYIKNN